MVLKQEYIKLLRQYPEYVSKEQMRIICHISKRTARFLLKSGLVPCIDSGKNTRNYKIAMTDIIAYLQKRKTMPEKYRMPSTVKSGVSVDLPDSEEFTHNLQEYYETLFADYPDVVTVSEVSEMIGYSNHRVIQWINAEKFKAFKRCTTYLVPKVCLIQFMIHLEYRKIENKSEKQKTDMGGFIKWQTERSL